MKQSRTGVSARTKKLVLLVVAVVAILTVATGMAIGTMRPEGHRAPGSDGETVGLVDVEGAKVDSEADIIEHKTPKVALGSLNKTVTSNGGHMYCAIQSTEGNASRPTPVVVRFDEGGSASAEVVWEGTPVDMGGIPLPPVAEVSDNGIVVLVPGEDWCTGTGLRAYAMSSDGSDSRELDFGRKVEWTLYGNPFYVDGNVVYYGVASRNGSDAHWEVRRCSIDGTSDSAVTQGDSGSAITYNGLISILGVEDGKVFFTVSHELNDGSHRSWVEAFSAPTVGGGVPSVVLTAEASGAGFRNVCLAGGRLFTTEGNELVSYDLNGGGRTTVAKVDGKKDTYIWNMTESVAYLYSTDSYPDTTCKVNLGTGAVEAVDMLYPDGGYPDLELVGDGVYMGHGLLSKVNNGYANMTRIWPADTKMSSVSGGDNQQSPSSTGVVESDGLSSVNRMLDGTWATADGNHALKLDYKGQYNSVDGDTSTLEDGGTASYVHLVDGKASERRLGGFDYHAPDAITVFSGDDKRRMVLRLDNGRLVNDELTFERIPDEVVNQFLGRWDGEKRSFSFEDNGDFHVYEGNDDDWGMYFVTSESTLIMSKKSGSFRAYDYSISGMQLMLDGKPYRRQGGDTSAAVLTSLKEAIVGTWRESEADNSTAEELRFDSNGNFGRYLTSYAPSDPNPRTSAELERGTYQVIDGGTVRLLTSGGYVYQDYTYDSGSGLLRYESLSFKKR